LITAATINHDEEIKEILKGNIPGHNGKLENIQLQVLSFFNKSVDDSVAKSIISSQLDADKMDYLRRDSYHTGSTYGMVCRRTMVAIYFRYFDLARLKIKIGRSVIIFL